MEAKNMENVQFCMQNCQICMQICAKLTIVNKATNTKQRPVSA